MALCVLCVLCVYVCAEGEEGGRTEERREEEGGVAGLVVGGVGGWCVVCGVCVWEEGGEEIGASCCTTSTRGVHAESSSCRRIWTCRRSESDQQTRDSSSLTDVRSKKTEAFFAGVIKGSEMMLELAAEQATEITMTAIDLEFLSTEANVDRGVQNLEFVLQQVHTAPMALTSYEANDIVAISRNNPFEARRLQKYDP